MHELHELNGIDYGIIGIISLSVLFGIVRGFVRESMSLITWIVAVTVGILYHETLAAWFTHISVLWVRLLLAFVLLVLGVLIIGGVISHLFSKLIRSTKFSITDRIVGTLFGFARGIVIVAAVILFINLMAITHKPLWEASVLVPKFEPVSLWIEENLPEDLLKTYKPSSHEKQKKEAMEWGLPELLEKSP